MQSENPLVGREAQIASFREACDRARKGQGLFILLSGEEGSGKSRLLAEVFSDGGFRLVSGRSHPESHLPFQPLREALRTVGRTPTPAVIPLPLAANRHEPLGRSQGTDGGCSLEEAQDQLSTAILESAVHEPIAILLEDLHHCDTATCEFLPCLAERIAGSQLLVVGIYRPEEVPSEHPIRRLRNELKRRHLYREIEVPPFTKAETGQLVAQLLGGPPTASLVSLLHEKTRGLPVFLEEICASLLVERLTIPGPAGIELAPGRDLPLPEGVRDSVLLKWAVLSQGARSLLEAACVLGPSIDFETLLAVEDSPGCLGELISSGLLVERARGAGRLRHELIREVVLEETPWTRRRDLHRKCADALAHAEAPPDWVAFHRLGSGDREGARAGFLRAAEEAFTVRGFSDAVVLYEQSLELWPGEKERTRRREALRNLAHAAQFTGQLKKAQVAWREVLESPPEEVGSEELAQASSGLAMVLTLLGYQDRATELRHQAAHSFDCCDQPREAALEWLEASDLLVSAARYSLALKDAETAVDRARRSGDSNLLALSLSQQAFAHALLGQAEEAHRHIDLAFEEALAGERPETLATVYRRLAYVHEYSGDYPQACRSFQKAVDFCQNNEIPHEMSVCLGCMAFAIMKIGDWNEARNLCRRVLQEEGSPLLLPRAVASGVLGLLCALRGEKKKARQLLHDSECLSKQIGMSVMIFFSRWGLALLEEEEGRLDVAAQLYRDNLDLWERSEDRADVVLSLYSGATLFSTLGLKSDLDRCAAILGQIVASSGNPEPLAGLAFVCGEVSLAKGRSAEAVGHFTQCLDRLEKLALPLESAFAHRRLAVAWVNTGSRKKAEEAFFRALRILRNLGARPLAAQIAGSMQEHGFVAAESRATETAPTAEISGLTRRQKEVAELIASGLTNKEIAGKLFISPRTVDMHVGHLLDRLDCRTRSEATQKLAKMGLV